jgi:hypothetical protein
MALFLRKKQLCLILAIYIALCILGAFSFAAVDNFSSVDFSAKHSMSGGILVFQDNYFLRHPMEAPVLISKLSKTQFTPLRINFQRFVSLLALPNIGTSFSKSPFSANGKLKYTNLKNNILLKLRI